MSSKKKQHQSGKQNMPSIRLGAGSGARGALKALTTGAHEEIDEDEGGDGLPNKRTYMLLRRLYETLDEPFNGEGLSWYDKVHSVKIDNAADLLYKTTWRDFFENGGKGVKQQKRGGSNSRASSPVPQEDKEEKKKHSSSEGDTKTRNDRSHSEAKVSAAGKKKNKSGTGWPVSAMGVTTHPETNLEKVFRQMIQRVELLWMELKVSESEREFYQHTLCKSPCAGMSQLNAISKYIVCLLDYRTLTIEVLEAIDERERSLAKVDQVTSSYLRRREEEEEQLARVQLMQQQQHSAHSTPVRQGIRSLRSHAQSGGRGAPGGKPLSLAETLSRHDDNAASHGTSVADSSPLSSQKAMYPLLREDLVQALHELQVLSVGVVRAVQQWRRLLWRPLPFIWQGVDYFQKMAHDTLFLDEEDGSGALIGDFINTIPLAREDLQGVLFVLPASKQDAGAPAAATVVTILNVAALSEEGLNNPLRQWFLEGQPDEGELTAACAVVTEEGPLIRALAAERARLADEGVFIPSLRVSFERERTTYPPSVPVPPSASALSPGRGRSEEKEKKEKEEEPVTSSRRRQEGKEEEGRASSESVSVSERSKQKSQKSSRSRRGRERERRGEKEESRVPVREAQAAPEPREVEAEDPVSQRRSKKVDIVPQEQEQEQEQEQKQNTTLQVEVDVEVDVDEDALMTRAPSPPSPEAEKGGDEEATPWDRDKEGVVEEAADAMGEVHEEEQEEDEEGISPIFEEAAPTSEEQAKDTPSHLPTDEEDYENDKFDE